MIFSSPRLWVVVVALALSSLSNATWASDPPSVDEQAARIQTVLQSITICVDLGRFDLLDRFYAEEVTADYSSLWGTAPRKLTRSEVGPAWAGFIPGFDTTRHALSNIVVRVEGSKATAHADVVASHWLDGETWEIRGKYFFELEKGSTDWVVKTWRFVLASESGDRSLVDVAEARAARERAEADRLLPEQAAPGKKP